MCAYFNYTSITLSISERKAISAFATCLPVEKMIAKQTLPACYSQPIIFLNICRPLTKGRHVDYKILLPHLLIALFLYHLIYHNRNFSCYSTRFINAAIASFKKSIESSFYRVPVSIRQPGLGHNIFNGHTYIRCYLC